MTGGFQADKGGWFLPKGIAISYEKGSVSDKLVESFAGTHDLLGGQIWGWYGKDGNTSTNRNTLQNIGAGVTTSIAIPLSAPFAISDFMSSDTVQFIFNSK